jgi:signal transduction histidine kinase
MKQRALWGSVAVIAVVNMALVLAVWWIMNPPVGSEIATHSAASSRPSAAAPPASAPVQRVAELLASTAFRSVITFNYAALNDLVRRAADWPEVIYVSVEDGQGRVIAHTDATRIGQVWTPAMARELAGTRAEYQEVTAAMSGREASGGSSAPVGQVRVGYVAPESKSAPPPMAAPAPARRRVPPSGLVAVLLMAAVVAIPLGIGVVVLAGREAAPRGVPVEDLKKIRSLRQARWTIAHWMKEADFIHTQLVAHRGEVERLEQELAVRTEELAQAGGTNEQLLRERADWLVEREHLTAELDGRCREVAQTRAALDEHAAELGDLREEVQEARAALAGHPILRRELIEQELRQHQHRVIAYICHAIRSSLTNVLGFAKLLLRSSDGPLNDDQRISALNIQAAGQHLLRVVNDLSDLTRAEAGTIEVRDEIVDVAAMLREVATAGASALARSPDAITVACPPELPPVRGDQRRLTQILLALVQPPLADSEGPTELSGRVEDESVTLIVTHPGASMPAQELPTLCDPFSPADVTSTLQDNGGRLRLALAKALAASIGAHLAVEAWETGTSFRITLPVAADVVAVA